MAYPRYRRGGPDLSRQFQDLLRRNGMQAHITTAPDGQLQLIVIGHDSPPLAYNISEQQAMKLTSWGGNYYSKEAYRTFVSIVKNDFELPQSYVAAANAGGFVQMGLNGYRLNEGEYEYHSRGWNRYSRGWGGGFLGWRPMSLPWNMRRMNGGMWMAARGGWVPVRPDGALKPGELKAGGYGFYYKGQRTEASQDVVDVINIQQQFKLYVPAARPEGEGIPYSERITSPVYFTAADFSDVLRSHGIVIDKENKTLTIQSSATRVDLVYTLYDKELEALLSDSLDEHSLQERLDIINQVIHKDYAEEITKEMLETNDLVDIKLKREVRDEVERKFIEQDRRMALADMAKLEIEERERIERDPEAINGRDIQNILGDKGWYQPVRNGRLMNVEEIRVQKNPDGTFQMKAKINGAWVSHAITAEQYTKFMEYDDAHRLKMFDKIFDEVEIKSAHGQKLYQDAVYYRDNYGEAMTTASDTESYESKRKSVDGRDLQNENSKVGFYHERDGGREVTVEKIEVKVVTPEAYAQMKRENKPEYQQFLQEAAKKAEKGETLYMMTATIDGKTVSHAISQKEYEKFVSVDDYHRMKLFAKIFDEVEIKTRPGEGTNVGAAVLAALTAATEIVTGVPYMPPPSCFASVSATHHPSRDYAAMSAANYQSQAQPETTVEQESTIQRGR